ncbi:hypothetical protein [Clostridium sp. UBA871]|uniref:hypothetical protein n=1 Tax=Clostridium sp. UBA871 TaxID=1946380 RepID=UPI003217D150
MYKVTRQLNGELRCNVECKICNSSFEFIDDKNGFAIVKNINVVNGKNESMTLDITAKCNICGYRTVYHGELEL